MVSNRSIVLHQLEKSELASAKIISGVSPEVLRRVFGGWIVFASIIAIIVMSAPQLTDTFVVMTFAVLLFFTLAIFGQSRISEGWPSIIYIDGMIGVVQDPQLRQFIMVPCEKVVDVLANRTKENRKVVELALDTNSLNEADRQVLNLALWPHEDRVVGMVYYKPRLSTVKAIKEKCIAPVNHAPAC